MSHSLEAETSEPVARGSLAPQAATPELAELSPAKMRELFELAYAVALALTKSRPLSDELVQTTFERLMTTRRWDGIRPIEVHVAGIVKSLLSNRRNSEKSERKEIAHERFHYEVVGQRIASPEDRTIENATEEERLRTAARELDELAAKVAGHPVAARVLKERAAGPNKPADIARAIGVPVDEVYRANDVLRRNLRAMRKRQRGKNDYEEGE